MKIRMIVRIENYTEGIKKIIGCLLIATSLILLFGGTTVDKQSLEKEPIAYIGHGGFFDQDGKQIEVTLEFLAKTQDWYRTKLLSSLAEDKRTEFVTVEKGLSASIRAEGQARLVVQQHLLDWLLANSKDISSDGRTVGKLNALKYALLWKLPDRSGMKNFRHGEEFKIDPEIENKLKSPEFTPPGFQPVPLIATLNFGQAYINECRAAGVPIPPPIGQLDPTGISGWKSQGFIPGNKQFIVGTPAEVRTYQSSVPLGMCIALPRYTDDNKTTVALDGVICLGQASSEVCFWDNQMPQAACMVGNPVCAFPFPAGTKIPIGAPDTSIDPQGRYQAGGFELNNGTGGVCTDCHAGQNPYIIHPNVNLQDAANVPTGVLMGQLKGQLNQQLPTFSASRYDPLVPASWPQNQLSQSPALVPAVCAVCHLAPPAGTGGQFPHLSSELKGYCGTILAQAITKTMPPSNPGGLAMNPDVVTFKNWCSVPASSGPSNRGDPHLTTTNGVNYDFQAAGEFTSLRNSATRFELQTRQTPVSTTSTPGANPYTGLASCVSLNTAVAVRVGKHRITYQPSGGKLVSGDQLQLRIDGALVRLPINGINFGNGNLITRADSSGGLDINLSDGTHLIITPNFWSSQGYWYLNVDVVNTPAREGTMGHIPLGNWLPLAPDGSSFGAAPASLTDRHVLLNQRFADAWRVTRATSLFDYAPGTSTDDFTDRDWPPKPGQPCKAVGATRPPVEPMKPEAARELCSKIKDKAAFENCVFDVTATGDAGMVKAYLRSLELMKEAAIGGP